MHHRGLLVCAAVALLGCSHEQPFETPDTGSGVPFLPGAPVRLTYNPGKDLRPAWAADGTTLFYAWEQIGQPDRDRCLGELPASGGSRLRVICDLDPAYADSVDLFDTPSPSFDGRLLYTRSTSVAGSVTPGVGGIFLGPLDDPLAGSELGSLPYTIPGGRTHGGITTPRWASATRLFYVGQSVVYARQSTSLPLDTLIGGLEIVELDVAGPQPSRTVVPGTYGASSVALNDARDTLYFTINNDSRVYRRAIAGGAVTIAHDFGSGGIARDITILGNRLVAVVGGEILYLDDPNLGPLQLDGGGPLVSVNLDTGDEAVLPTDVPLIFRHPEFAPGTSPTRLVAEGYAPTPPPGPATWHQFVSRVGELYLFEAP